MQTKKTLPRFLSVLLAFCMLVGLCPAAVFADEVIDDVVAVQSLDSSGITFTDSADGYYSLISKKDWELAPGIYESEIVLNNASGSHRQVAHVVEVDLDNEYTKVIPSYKGMIPTAGNYGTQIMSQQAAFAEANGYGNVVAAMNLSLSWYDSQYYIDHPELVGEPLGYMILDGVQYTNSNGPTSGAQTCVVINFNEKDGVARPSDIPRVEIRSTASPVTGWEEQVIPANFGFLVNEGKNVATKPDHAAASGASRSFVGIKADGTFVMVMNDGRQAPYSAGFTNYEMGEFMLSLGCVYAVNGDGGGSSAFLSQRPGEELKINCSPSDGAERPTTHGILVISTAPATGEFVRATITAEHDYYTPGSTVEFSALGTDFVGTVAAIPADAVWQLADPSMGTIADGVFVSNGKVGTATAQLVYNGKVVGEASVEIVIPTEFSFAQGIMTVPYDKEVNIDLIATINGGIHEVVLKPSDVVFSTTNEALGTFNGFKFTSVSEDNAPESFTSTVTATLVHDTSLVATAELNLGRGSEILFDFEDASDIYDWNIADVNGNDAGFYQHLSYATAADGQVHNGIGSMRVEMNPISAPNISSGGYAQSDLYLNNGVVVENAKSIGFWAYIPDEYEHCWIRVLYWYDSNGDGKFESKNTISVINQPEVYNTMDESGWKYFSVDVSKYSKILIAGTDCKDLIAYNASKNDPNNFRFVEFMFPHTNTNDLWKTYGTINGLQTIYIDNITADFSDAVDDREAPIFSNVSLTVNDEAVTLGKYDTVKTTSNLLTVMAAVAENTAKANATGLNANSAKAYIDGVPVEVSFANGRLMINDVAVADGIHRIKFEICDNAGNKSVVIRLVEVTSGVDASTVQVVPADPTLDRLYGGSVYWMNVDANKIETIKSVKAVIDLNYGNHWELDHMVLAEGFSADYTIDTENNTATIVITRTGNNSQTGANTIASLPIRVIYYDTDIHIDGYTAERYWKEYAFWPYDVKVDVDMGEIQYVDGYTSIVLNAFSNEEFSVDTEIYTASAGVDSAYLAQKGTAHVHTAVALDDKAATCTESGYTGRTYCEVCASVVAWGAEVEASGHDWQFNEEGKLACVNNPEELYNGSYTDGKTYVDGVAVGDGWVEINGEKVSYYKDGEKLVGSHFIDGAMYTFDENGIYMPDFKYDGWYEIDDTVMFFSSNNYFTGFNVIQNNYYNFDKDGKGYDGEVTLCGQVCLFDNGLSVADKTVKMAGICGEDVHYVLYQDGRLVVDGTGAIMEYRSIGSVPYHQYRYDIKSIEIGAGITTVGRLAFYSLIKVEKITFAEGSQLTRLSDISFSRNYLVESITLPEGLKWIGDSVFLECKALTEVIMPTSLNYVASSAFLDCANVTLKVAKGSYAHTFAEKYKVNYELLPMADIVGTCGDATWTLTEEGTLTISGSGRMGDNANEESPWQGYANMITKVVIGKDITYIGKFNFYKLNNLTEVVFEEGTALKTIGWGTFGFCKSLETITIPASVEVIDGYAFYYCTALKTVSFENSFEAPSALTSIGMYAFWNDAALESFYVPDKVLSFAEGTFTGCPKTTNYLVARGTYSHNYFKNANITLREPIPYTIATGTCGDATWTLESTGVLTVSGSGVMADNASSASPWQQYADLVTKVVVGKDITYIGSFNFYKLNNLTEVVFEEGTALKTIGWGAFGFCKSLETITIPASVEVIDGYAFYYCTALKTVSFENSALTSIGMYAFWNDVALESINYPAGTSIGEGAFIGCSKLAK